MNDETVLDQRSGGGFTNFMRGISPCRISPFKCRNVSAVLTGAFNGLGEWQGGDPECVAGYDVAAMSHTG